MTHYLEALEWQKEIVKIHTIFGGKNPHPNYLVGGVPCSINPDEVNAINMDRLNYVGSLINGAIAFVEQVYMPDLMAIAGFYKDWAAIGGGLKNYLAYGDLPTRGYNQPDYFKFARGAILDRNLNEVYPVNGRDAEEIKEYIAHSWYSYSGGDASGLHPFDGETEFNYTGPKPPYEQLNVEAKYSWLKTPRWKDHPMEVGPLARLLVSYAKGSTEVKDVVNEALGQLGVPVTALFSTLGRTAARGLETRLVVHWMKGFYDELMAQVKTGELSTFTRDTMGAFHVACNRTRGWTERGAAWRAGPLDQDQGWEDRQLPTGGAQHLERIAARPQRPAVSLRGVADRHAPGQSGAAAGNPADDPLFRSVYRLRCAPVRSRWQARSPDQD